MLTFDYEKHKYGFRQILVLSTLNGYSVQFNNLTEQCLSSANLCFMKLLSLLSDKSEYVFLVKPTKKSCRLIYRPGILIGGVVNFDCQNNNLGYILEYLICIIPFTKNTTELNLKGITNQNHYLSVDYVHKVLVRNMEKFTGLTNKEIMETSFVDIKIIKRSFGECGDGLVTLKNLVTMKYFKPFILTDVGKVLKIRGIVVSNRVNSANANRILYGLREILNRYIPDIYISLDVAKSDKITQKPGYGVMLYSQSTTDVFKGTELYVNEDEIPEDIGRKAAINLLREIADPGCFDSYTEGFMMLCGALCSKDIFKLMVSKCLNINSAYNLRTIYEVCGIKYKLDKMQISVEKQELEGCLVIGAGAGISNIAKKIV